MINLAIKLISKNQWLLNLSLTGAAPPRYLASDSLLDFSNATLSKAKAILNVGNSQQDTKRNLKNEHLLNLVASIITAFLFRINRIFHDWKPGSARKECVSEIETIN